jgi:hypothetical protein
MSSSSGPGQKLPRASISLSIVVSVTLPIVALLVAPTGCAAPAL